jgi:two-component system chemotaxis response regulator CheV
MSGVLDTVDMRTRLAGQNRLELLLFRLKGKQRYGINVFKVQEVIQCPAMNQVPHAHRHVSGVATLRGRTIPIINLASSIGLPAPDDVNSCFVIVTEFNRKVQGFMVAGVDRIVNIDWNDVLPPPKGAGNDSYMTAITRYDEELIEIIDVEKVLVDVIGEQGEMSEELVSQAGAAMAENERTILVVDDSSVARNQVRRTLERMGIKVELAGDGKEALDKLKALAADGVNVSDYYAMVISDIEMPEMDGYTLTRNIREDGNLAGLYIVLHTSLSGVFNKSMVEKVGANEFIPKFNADDLGGTVMRQLDKQGV